MPLGAMDSTGECSKAQRRIRSRPRAIPSSSAAACRPSATRVISEIVGPEPLQQGLHLGELRGERGIRPVMLPGVIRPVDLDQLDDPRLSQVAAAVALRAGQPL